MSRFCGRCGAPAAPANVFCVSCGSALEPQGAGTAAGAPPVATTAVPLGPPSASPSLSGQAPWGAWPPPPPKRRNTRTILIVAVIVVVAIVVFSIIAILTNQPRATFVDITKSGASGNSMFFSVTIRTSGAAVDADQLHVDLRSVRAGVTFDDVVYYNLERIPGGTLFTWDLDIAIDPLDEPSFSYVFTLEVNDSRTDSSTVT